MEFAPFGQDGIPPTAVKAAKCRKSCIALEFFCKKGIEAFNLLNFSPSYLPIFPTSSPSCSFV
jgi:hypothetical protein